MRLNRNVITVIGVLSLMEGIGEIIFGSLIANGNLYDPYDYAWLSQTAPPLTMSDHKDSYGWYATVVITLGASTLIAAIFLLAGVQQMNPKFLAVNCCLMTFNIVNYMWIGTVLLAQNQHYQSFYGSYCLIWGGIAIFFVFFVMEYRKMMLNPQPRMPLFASVTGYPQQTTFVDPPLVLVNGSTQQNTVYSIPNRYPAPGIYPPPGSTPIYVNSSPNSGYPATGIYPATGTYTVAGGYSVDASYQTA